MQKELNENLKHEDIFKDPKFLAQTIWTKIVTVHDSLKPTQATLTISDDAIMLSYSSNEKIEFISFPYGELDKIKVFELVYDTAGKSQIRGKVYRQKTVMQFVFHY